MCDRSGNEAFGVKVLLCYKNSFQRGDRKNTNTQNEPPPLNSHSHTHSHTYSQKHRPTHVHFSNGFLKKGPQLQRGKSHRESICLSLQSSYTSLKTPWTSAVTMDTCRFIPSSYSVIFLVYLSFSRRPVISMDWLALLLHTRTCCFLSVSMS